MFFKVKILILSSVVDKTVTTNSTWTLQHTFFILLNSEHDFLMIFKQLPISCHFRDFIALQVSKAVANNRTVAFHGFLDPEGGSQSATLVVHLVLLVVVTSSVKIPKTFLIRSGAQRIFAYTFFLIFPTDLPSQMFKTISN